MRSVKVALAASTIVIAAVIVGVLSRSPSVVAGTNAITIAGHADLPTGNVSSCQRVGAVPQGTSAIRVSIGSGAGPRIRLDVVSASRIVTHGELPAGWGLAAETVVPVKTLTHPVRDAVVCTSLGAAAEPIRVEGRPRPGSANGAITFSRIDLRMEYLRPGARSWFSLASTVAYRMGLGRAESGTWITFLALLLVVAAGVAAARLAVRELR